MTRVLALIPARSGSKSVPDKNIRLFNGKPMLAWSVLHAQRAETVNRIIVSTDSQKYAEIAAQYGAETPFLRPAEISGDASLDIEVFEHALSFLKEQENYLPEIIVHLRPTYPLRNPSDIDRMVELLSKDAAADAVRCIAPAKETPYKMWRCGKDGILHPLLDDISEAYNMPRQQLPQVYYQNACIDVVRHDTIMKKGSMTGDRIIGYCMNENYDIDTEEEFREAEARARNISMTDGNEKSNVDQSERA